MCVSMECAVWGRVCVRMRKKVRDMERELTTTVDGAEPVFKKKKKKACVNQPV